MKQTDIPSMRPSQERTAFMIVSGLFFLWGFITLTSKGGE